MGLAPLVPPKLIRRGDTMSVYVCDHERSVKNPLQVRFTTTKLQSTPSQPPRPPIGTRSSTPTPSIHLIAYTTVDNTYQN
jgi:hypothetical protein